MKKEQEISFGTFLKIVIIVGFSIPPIVILINLIVKLVDIFSLILSSPF